MITHQGWLLDVYSDEEDGLVLWLLGRDGTRHRLHQTFPITFYISGPFPRLREVWRYLSAYPLPLKMSRAQREDLFSGILDVMAIQVDTPALQPRLLHDLLRWFPDLDYYDADIPLALRYGAAYDLFPLAHCRVVAGEDGQIQEISALDSPWDLAPELPSLRTVTIIPDVDPSHMEPEFLTVTTGHHRYRVSLKPLRLLLIQLHACLKRYDPDLVLTRWGDTWLFPTLLDAQHQMGTIYFNPNRDLKRPVLRRQENSYFTYGQVIYRGQQVHLFGRWHIDQYNAIMYGEYGLAGVLEQARVTGLPVQEVARKSPGAGITARQMQVALQEGILIPYQKQQAERFKTAQALLRSDRGGMVYQPSIGLHQDVAEIDFVSMYPSIMVHFNISPETVGVKSENARIVPELGIFVDQTREGLIPKTIRPLLAKRIAIKQRLAKLNHQDCRYQPLKAHSAALKWLLVVCFGYMGYKHARFGRIESHEAVTAYGREALLRAKEAAEALGFTVLHMYVDGLWVKRPGTKAVTDLQPLLDEILSRTGLTIALEGVYRWIAFLPSRLDDRVPVANRNFGLFRDGTIKTRGIEMRRHDTPPFITQAQRAILGRMAGVPDGHHLEECLPDVVQILRRYLTALQDGHIQLEHLLVSQTLSRPLDEYRVLSPAARALQQLQAMGKSRRPGQRIRFLYTRGEPGVYAWDLASDLVPAMTSPPPNPATVDISRYSELLIRAAGTLLQPLGIDESVLRVWLLDHTYQRCFGFLLVDHKNRIEKQMLIC